jgi:hypothetical protein
MSQVTTKLMMVRQRLELAALAAKREPEDIQLLAVSKTFPAIAVEEAMPGKLPLVKIMSKKVLTKFSSYPNCALG